MIGGENIMIIVSVVLQKIWNNSAAALMLRDNFWSKEILRGLFKSEDFEMCGHKLMGSFHV